MISRTQRRWGLAEAVVFEAAWGMALLTTTAVITGMAVAWLAGDYRPIVVIITGQ